MGAHLLKLREKQTFGKGDDVIAVGFKNAQVGFQTDIKDGNCAKVSVSTHPSMYRSDGLGRCHYWDSLVFFQESKSADMHDEKQHLNFQR